MNNNITAHCVALATACLALVPVSVQAQTAADSAAESTLDEAVITATRSGDPIRADLLGSSFTVIDPQDLELRQTRIVSDVLRDVPGVSVNRNGTVGGLTQVRMRGAEGNHTLVLIDGIKASDPYFGEFDFATLLADDVARVEVLRGQQSALYGSDAIGGIISYSTLTGREAPGARVRLEGGSFGTVDASARYGGVSGPFDYALSAGIQNTDGTSNSRFGSRDLGSENTAASARFDYAASDTFRIKAVARYSRTTADTNRQDFNDFTSPTYGFAIDGDDNYENRAIYGLVRAELDTLGGRWTHALSAQGVDAKRDSFADAAFSNGDDGSRGRYSYETTLHFGTESLVQSLTGAFDYERENYQNRGPFLTDEMGKERHSTNRGVVLEYDGSVNNRIGYSAALRHDDNDLFEGATTFRVQGSYRFDGGFRLRAAAGSGIKNPGIFELFGFDPESFTGNPNLKPEKSTGWEAGAEQSFADDHARIGVTYFDSKLKDEIYPIYTEDFSHSSPGNRTTDSTQKGVELSVDARLAPAWRIDAAYTYLRARENGVEEVRRPPHIGSLNVDWRTAEGRGGLALTVRYNGTMRDNNFTFVYPGVTVKMPSYTLVNLGADWKLSKMVQLYGRVENLFDEEYEEVFTFRSPGRAGYVGARLTF